MNRIRKIFSRKKKKSREKEYFQKRSKIISSKNAFFRITEIHLKKQTDYF